MNVADSISELVARAREAPDEERTHEVLKAIRALPGVEELSGPLTFRTGEHQIQVGLTANLEKAVSALSQLRPLKLSIAPEVVAQHPFSDHESVLVTRWAACAGERLAPIKPGQSAISDASRARARKELARLAEQGMIHGYASRGFAHWLSSSDKNTLVLDGWTSLRPASAEEGAEQLERIDALLERLA